MKSFGEIFGESWKEYKKNFRTFTIIFLLLSVLPTIIYFAMQTPASYEIYNSKVGGFFQMITVFLGSSFAIPAVIVFILMILLGILMTASYIYIMSDNTITPLE